MLTNQQIAAAKGYLAAGYKQHDIAAHFGVNGGRIADIATGKTGADVAPAPIDVLPSLSKKAPRFLAPGQTVEEQVSILDELLATSRGVARPLWISPELAAHVLQNRNGGNRKINSMKVEELVHALEDDNFQITGATIIFGVSGRLLDGQHRLLACVRSGKAIKSYVVFGIEDGAFALIDTGRRRTNMDCFHIGGIPKPEVTAKAVRWLMILTSNPLNRATYQNEEVLNHYLQHVDAKALTRAITDAEEIERTAKVAGSKLPAPAVAALVYLFRKSNRKEAEEFVRALVENRGVGRSVHRFIKNTLERNNGRMHEVTRNAAITKAWNAHCAGESVSLTSIRWNEASGEDYPSIA